MRVVFSPEARQEFEEGERYYNRQVPQLGSQFRGEIRDCPAAHTNMALVVSNRAGGDQTADIKPVPL